MFTFRKMPSQASPPQTSDSSTDDTASRSQPSSTLATSNEPVVRRRRSSQRPRRSKTKKISTQDHERRLKRRLEVKVLLIATPTLLLIAGGTIWVLSNADPDESMHPKGLIRLSYYMLGIGLAMGASALLVDWTQKFVKIQKEKREKIADNAALKRRRSSHRRHRSK